MGEQVSEVPESYSTWIAKQSDPQEANERLHQIIVAARKPPILAWNNARVGIIADEEDSKALGSISREKINEIVASENVTFENHGEIYRFLEHGLGMHNGRWHRSAGGLTTVIYERTPSFPSNPVRSETLLKRK